MHIVVMESDILVVLGCSFHFGPAVWRHIQHCSLTKKYHDDIYFHLSVRILIALAFVSVVDVVKAFEQFENEFDNDAR